MLVLIWYIWQFTRQTVKKPRTSIYPSVFQESIAGIPGPPRGAKSFPMLKSIQTVSGWVGGGSLDLPMHRRKLEGRSLQSGLLVLRHSLREDDFCQCLSWCTSDWTKAYTLFPTPWSTVRYFHHLKWLRLASGFKVNWPQIFWLRAWGTGRGLPWVRMGGGRGTVCLTSSSTATLCTL